LVIYTISVCKEKKNDKETKQASISFIEQTHLPAKSYNEALTFEHELKPNIFNVLTTSTKNSNYKIL
jgi:hypothetical protein